MTTTQLQTLLDAFDKLQKHIEDSFDQFKQEMIREVDAVPEIPGFEGTWDALNKLTIIHPQDIADKELSDLESEADLIHSQEEDKAMDNNY